MQNITLQMSSLNEPDFKTLRLQSISENLLEIMTRHDPSHKHFDSHKLCGQPHYDAKETRKAAQCIFLQNQAKLCRRVGPSCDRVFKKFRQEILKAQVTKVLNLKNLFQKSLKDDEQKQHADRRNYLCISTAQVLNS